MSKEPPGLLTSSLKMDMMHFKDETLRDMRQMHSKLDTKYTKVEETLNENLAKFDLKVKSLEQKIFELSNLITNDSSLKDKVESLIQFKEEMKDTIFKRRAKFSELEKKVNDDIDNINKILTSSVIYPGIIGKNTKFLSFHDFIDFCMQEIGQLIIFKNKSGMDIGPFKKKVETSMEAFRLQINNLVSKEVANQMINDLEQRINSNFKLYDDKIKKIRVDNSEYSITLQKKSKELNKQIENLMTAQLFINRKLDKIQNLENINILINEVSQINSRINKIVEIIMELMEFHPEIKNKSNKQIISGVKQYIKGNLNAQELSSMKIFSYDKSKGFVSDIASLIKKNISPESSSNKFPFQNLQSGYINTKPIILGEDRSNIINKKFLNKKTMNFSNKNNNKFSEQEKLKKKPLMRKNTVSVGNNFIFNESSKMNNLIKKISGPQNAFLNGQISDRYNHIIEEENEVNNNSNHSILNENENNKSIKIKKVKPMINNNYDKNDNFSKEEIKAAFKRNNSEELLKDENSKDKVNIKNENEKIEKANINNNNLKDDEKKKILLINSNQKDKNNIKNDDLKKENEIKINKSNENDHKNHHARNNETLALNKKDLDIEPNDTNIVNKVKSRPFISNLNIQNNNESHDSVNPIPDDKGNKESNKILIPINYDYKPTSPDIKIISIKKKLYKTDSDFPKLNHNSFDNKIKLNNNISPPTTLENYTKTIIDEDKYHKNKNMINNAPIIKHQKKILLMNPDDLPLNYFDKTYKDIFKNNFNGNHTDRSSYNKNKGINLLNKIDSNFKDYYKNIRSTEERDKLLKNKI